MAQADRYRREYPVHTLAVTEVEAEMGAEYNYFGETLSSNGSGETRTTNNYFQEYLLGRIRGYGYHPRFIDYSGSLRLGLAQENLEYSSPQDGTSTSSDNDTLIGYNFRMDILKEYAASGTVSASRDERILMGLFVDRYRTKTDSYSATARWRSTNLSTDATVTHTETEDFGFRSRGTSSSDSFIYNLRHDVGRRIRTDIRYRIEDFERDFTSRTNTGENTRRTESLTNDLNITNRIAIDPREQLTLRSTFRYQDRDGREGIQDLRSWYLEELLRYNASRLARPYIRASARRNEFDIRNVDTYRAEAGFDGDLFESLSYHFDLHATHPDYETFTEDRYGPTGRLDYRKLTGAGLLSAGYSRTLDQVERSGMTGIVPIIDEPLVIRTAVATFLQETNVIASSIVVTDTSSQIVYQEGFDYEIVLQGARVGLRALPGGLLPDGTAVLVNYSIDAQGDQSYLADDEAFSVRHDFSRFVKDLSLYGRRHTFRARNVDVPGDLNVVEYTDDTVGLRQGWREFAFTTEYEMYDDDLGGYDRWLNQLEGYHDLGREIRLGWNLGSIQTWYNDDFSAEEDDKDDHLFASAHLDGSFARTGYWRLEGNIMDDTGRTERTTKGIIGRIGYQWRRITLETGARYEDYDAPSNDHERMQFFLGMKYHFGKRTYTGLQR
jgi:hypothetical protein